MCSTAGDIEDITACSTDFHSNIRKETLQKCKKCPEKSSVVLQKKDPFCKSCFFEYCNHKFRSTIGKSKKVKHGGKVLLACSGGRKSALLLHMTIQTLKSASLKQITFTPGIIFIDDSFILSNSTEVKSNITPVLKELEKINYPILCSSLEMVYKVNSEEPLYSVVSNETTVSNFPCDAELRTRMRENFENISLSSKIDLLRHLKLLLITEIADQAGYDCVFVGDSASSLAIDLLSDIAFGRGSQISSDTSFYDTRYKVPVCRPLREFLNKEVALYNHLHNTVYEVFPDFLTMTSSKSCIQRLTEEFLLNLQENFPATIFTVFRTGGKLSKNNIQLDQATCIICKSELDGKNSDPCSALEALKISEKLSTYSSDQALKEDNSYDLMKFLCHGCSICFKNMAKSHYFQPLVSEVSIVKLKTEEMKEGIKEFLLDENNCS